MLLIALIVCELFCKHSRNDIRSFAEDYNSLYYEYNDNKEIIIVNEVGASSWLRIVVFDTNDGRTITDHFEEGKMCIKDQLIMTLGRSEKIPDDTDKSVS